MGYMILNFYYSKFIITILVVTWLFTNYFLTLNTLSTNIIDIYTRLVFNDFYLNIYYFFWTNFWYLTTFVLILFVLHYITMFNKHIKAFVLSILPILLVLLVSQSDYFLSNPQTMSFMVSTENLNNLLTNSINKYHPFIFYFSSSFIFSMFISSRTLTSDTYSFTRSIALLYYTNYLFTALYLISFTLFLGSWWALQEGSWGGWWNWDPSEVFGLCIMLFFTVLIHTSTTIYRTRLIYLFVAYSTKVIFLIYIFIQLNFDLVSHNFGTKVDDFIDSTSFYLTLLTLILSSLIFVFFRDKSRLNTLLFTLKTYSNYLSIKFFWRIFLYGFILYLVLSSFFILLNDFSWKLLSINILNLLPNTHNTVLYVFWILIVLLWVFNFQNFLILTTSILFMNPVDILLILVVLNNRFYVGHFALVLFIYLSAVSFNHSVSNWLPILQESVVFVSTSQFYSTLSTLTFTTTFVDITKINLFDNVIVESAWNFITTGTTCEAHSFAHLSFPDYSIQGLHSTNQLFTFMILILEPNTLLLLSLCYLIICMFYAFSQRIYRIIL